MGRARKKRLKSERFLIGVIIFLVVSFPLVQVFSTAMLSKTQIEVESMRKKVSSQEQLNESLSMKINELASLDKIQTVASKEGLEYNNNNIKTVNE